MDYLAAACERLKIKPGRVLSHRVGEEYISVVVDNGVAGCPKYKIPLADLAMPEEGAARWPDLIQTDEPANATDSARDLAFEHGLDVRAIQGSGAGGRVLKRDVEALL